MSKIERIEVLAVGPDVPRTTWASMPDQQMALTLVRVWDSDGACGVGAAQSYAAEMFDLSVHEAIRALAPRILGKDAIDHEARWRDLQTHVQPATPGAVSAIDVALWDLAACHANLPLYRLLGGAQTSIEAYASTPELPDVKSYFAMIEDLASTGYKAIKFHAWNDPSRDLELLTAVHKEYRDSPLVFMHDAENRYDRYSALRVGQAMADMGYRWFEAPLTDYDLDGYCMLRERCNIPIVPHGLWMSDIREIAQALRVSPWDAVRFDVTAVGGFTPALKICALAEAYGLPVETQSWGYTAIQAPALHFALGLGRATYFESPVPYEPYEFAVMNPIRPDADGRVSATDAPGLGLEFDWRAIEAATLDRYEFRA